MKRTMPKMRRSRTREQKARPRRLATYRAKRDFARTPEPSDQSSQTAGLEEKKTSGVFCVQKHDATRLHYDVRLEIDGALMSCAVPERAELRPSGQAPRGRDRRPPDDVRRLRGADPGRPVRRGRRAHLGPRDVRDRAPRAAAGDAREGAPSRALLRGEARGGWHFVRTKGTAPGDESRGGAKAARRSGSCSRRRTRRPTRRATSSPSAPSR